MQSESSAKKGHKESKTSITNVAFTIGMVIIGMIATWLVCKVHLDNE